jgi:hypothetical protein
VHSGLLSFELRPAGRRGVGGRGAAQPCANAPKANRQLQLHLSVVGLNVCIGVVAVKKKRAACVLRLRSPYSLMARRHRLPPHARALCRLAPHSDPDNRTWLVKMAAAAVPATSLCSLPAAEASSFPAAGIAGLRAAASPSRFATPRKAVLDHVLSLPKAIGGAFCLFRRYYSRYMCCARFPVRPAPRRLSVRF